MGHSVNNATQEVQNPLQENVASKTKKEIKKANTYEWAQGTSRTEAFLS